MDTRGAIGRTICCLAAALAGCSGNPFRTAGPPPPGLAPPVVEAPGVPGLTGPSTPTLPYTPPVATVAGGSDAVAVEARRREQTEILEEEVAALREQLASTSRQLATTRHLPTAPATPSTSDEREITGDTVMHSAMSQLALDDLPVRFDGSVVRIELPAERLFEPGEAALVPGAAALLTTVAEEIDRVYPDHYVGIEGHTDTSPLPGIEARSPHELAAARAEAVLQFVAERTPLAAKQLFLVAHGANHPVVSNATSAGRARNRRMEFVVYPELAPRQ